MGEALSGFQENKSLFTALQMQIVKNESLILDLERKLRTLESRANQVQDMQTSLLAELTTPTATGQQKDGAMGEIQALIKDCISKQSVSQEQFTDF